MKKISHIIWTFSISLWIYQYFFNFNIIENIFLSFITGFFSSLPDIDLKIVNYFKKLNYKTIFLTFPLYYIIKIIFKHRTITHSFLFASIFYILYFLLLNIFNFYHLFNFIVFGYNLKLNLYLAYFFLILFLAVILHIFEDSLTVAGVKPFYPINIKIRLAKFRTNSTISQIILDLIGFLIGILFFIF